MDDNTDQAPKTLEEFWDAILSRDPRRIRVVYQTLDSVDQKRLLEHLRKMASEDGWHPDQRTSALAALDAISDHPA